MFGFSQKEKNAALSRAFAESSAQQVIDALKKGADPDAAAGRHGVPLFAAFGLYRESNVAAVVEALIIKGANVNACAADGNSVLHYAASYNKDPEFYDFYRAMQSYRVTFVGMPGQPANDTTIILSPQDGYLRQFAGKGSK